jgi:transposase
MHKRYRKWNSVFTRFRRWAEQGVWDGLLETLVELGLTDDWQTMIDSTTVRGHWQAHGAKGVLIRRLLREPISCDHSVYKGKNRIEQTFNEVKQFRRVATHYDKTKVPFDAFQNVAAMPLRLRHFLNRTYRL